MNAALIWFTTALSVLSIAVAALHALRAVTGHDAIVEAPRATVAIGMGLAFTPAINPLPVSAWILVFSVVATSSAVLAIRVGLRRRSAGHHLVCGLAMVFMLVEAPSMVASAVALLVLGYFVWYVLDCVQRSTFSVSQLGAPVLMIIMVLPVV